MFRNGFYLLIAILSSTLSANENTYYQHESNVAFHVAVESLYDAVLAIEGQNGLIFNSRWIFGEIGTPIADICEGQQSPDLELGCDSVSTTTVESHFDFPQNSQIALYFRPNLIVNGFKLIEASVKNNEVAQLLFEDDNTKELFIVNKHQLNDIIAKKLTKKEFQQKIVRLKADAIDPNEG
ncbi:hypothetical protein AUR67_05040 [Pseudoalteromonas sp. XI10]|uniref:hypothetical protein n=1 Tax=Pseudoalteromonas sp. XI10 TaxID=1766621 RepID=UPI00073344C6|nr:hypothetical protein [Pseudoalteromonas sp. XI10]KTG21555.1 hypothetical protein AUR67_05040 [Pseudoalteromonas sp. XI10]